MFDANEQSRGKEEPKKVTQRNFKQAKRTKKGVLVSASKVTSLSPLLYWSLSIFGVSPHVCFIGQSDQETDINLGPTNCRTAFILRHNKGKLIIRFVFVAYHKKILCGEKKGGEERGV